LIEGVCGDGEVKDWLVQWWGECGVVIIIIFIVGINEKAIPDVACLS